MFLAFVGGPVVLAMGAYEQYRANDLKSNGFTVPGKLEDSNVINTGKGRSSHRVTLKYFVESNNTRYSKEFIVNKVQFDEAERNGELEVTFLPTDPAFSMAGGVKGNSEMFAMGGGILFVGVAIWLYRRRQLQALNRYMTADDS